MTTTAVPKTYPGTDWVRTVTFHDACHDTGTDAPVHVCNRVTFNGEVPKVRIRKDLPLTVESNGGMGVSEALVSFVVHADDVTMFVYDRPYGPKNRPLIGRWEVLVPPGEDNAHQWAVEDHTDDGDWVRVWFMAREIHFE